MSIYIKWMWDEVLHTNKKKSTFTKLEFKNNYV